MRIFLDTSGLFAYLDAADPRNAGAVALFGRLHDERAELVTHNYVAVELIALLHRRFGKAVAARASEEIMAPVEIRWITPSLHTQAQASFRDSRRSASFVDQVSFAVMRSEGLTTAFAYDNDFRRAGFETIP